MREAPTPGGAPTGGSSGAERAAQRVTFEVETPVTESITVDSQQQQQPLFSDSADNVQGDTDDADVDSDAADSQSEDTVSGGASQAPHSPILHRLQRPRKEPDRYGD